MISCHLSTQNPPRVPPLPLQWCTESYINWPHFIYANILLFSSFYTDWSSCCFLNTTKHFRRLHWHYPLPGIHFLLTFLIIIHSPISNLFSMTPSQWCLYHDYSTWNATQSPQLWSFRSTLPFPLILLLHLFPFSLLEYLFILIIYCLDRSIRVMNYIYNIYTIYNLYI